MINGKRLKALRKREKISAVKLAELLGIGRQQVVRYEAEQTDPSSASLIKLALFFNVSVDYLLGLDSREDGINSRTLRTIRQNKGLSAEKAAGIIGLTKQQLLAYESGKTEPGAKILIKIARAYGVTTDELFRAKTD